MANNYLDDLLGKISAYDLFNVLIPGALVTYSVSQMPLGSCIDCSNWLALFVMSYVLGLIASRIGSLCIEPLVRKLKPTGKRDYSAFAYAQKRDPKVEQLLMISNMYRSLAGAGWCSASHYPACIIVAGISSASCGAVLFCRLICCFLGQARAVCGKTN